MFGGQQQGGFGGFGGQQGGFGMPQMQSPYGPQQGGFGGGFGGFGGGFGGGFNPYQQQMQSPYGPQMGGFGGGFGGMMGGGFNPYQQGMMGGFGGMMGGFNPYQMQSPKGPQMGGFGGGFGGMGGFGRGRGRGMGGFGDQQQRSYEEYASSPTQELKMPREQYEAQQGMFSGNRPDPRMRADIPRQLSGTPQPVENMPQQYSPEEYLKRGLQMQAQNASMNNRGGIEARPQYQDSNTMSAAVMPTMGTMDRPGNYGRNSDVMSSFSRLFG
jgi:hypothetical protein